MSESAALLEPSALISACILARNEEHRIEDALRSLQGWTDQIIVLDNESEDQTAAVARRHADLVLTVPRANNFANNFDGARNLAVDHASGDWIFYLDADERVPPGLGPMLRRLVQQQGAEFEALLIPFKHYFCGQWIRHSGWWPGYTRPQLLKKGAFHYNSRLHSGISVEGRTLFFPADDPDLAIVHYSYDDLHHYLEKLNRYTDGEAESLLSDGVSHSWQAQLAHFVHDWQVYYERHQGDRDGMGGFVLAFLSGFYRFASRAKLWDLRRQRGELTGPDPVPGSLREMLEFMARVCQEGAQPWLDAPKNHVPKTDAPQWPAPNAPAAGSIADSLGSLAETPRLPLLWCAPLADASGYADEARNFVLGLVEAGEPLSVSPLVWSDENAGLSPEMEALLQERTAPPDAPADIFVSQTLPLQQRPSSHALVNVARTMFETDGLPPGAAQALNRMDRVWVPSEFNRETFTQSGVAPEKIAVIPGALDPAPFAAALDPWPLPGGEAFRFLSVFDWTRHKGWDVLLEAFAQEFGNDPAVGLTIKTWSSNGYALEDIRAQAGAWLQETLGHPLESFPNIHLWQERLPAGEMPRLYRAVDCFVLPTRGEGWGRPLMEAMAAGLPTVATAWSGLTEFHDARVGYPLKYALEPVSEAGAREIPLYAGHRWAEPDLKDLRRLMRRVVDHPEAARKKGRAAQKVVTACYSRPAMTARLQDEIAYCRTLAASKLDALRSNALRGAELKAIDAAGAGAGLRASGPVPSRRPGLAQPLPGSQPPNLQLPGRQAPLRPAANLVPVESLPAVDFRVALGRPLRVRWEGDQSIRSSLAHVNRELCLGLLKCGDVELSLAEQAGPWHTLTERDEPRLAALTTRLDAPLSGPVDVTIRHHFPPDWRRPETGKLVVMQPWEWGHLPCAWVEGAARHADEVWAYSRFVRDVYVRSGVPAEKVRVVPLGVRPDVFTPDGPVYPAPTRKSTRFLFVGGALERKGADLLLEAYRRAFTRADDVCLIVKDMGTGTFYQGQTFADDFRRAQDDEGGPEVVYLDGDLPESELASLYRACTCVALPYRAEGFGLSPLEGMACGRPAIVTAGGPADDYLDDALALRVPFRYRSQGSPRIGPWECAGDPWHLEPDPDALVDALRWVRDHAEETRQRGAEARAHVQAGWTWGQSVDTARLRLWKLVHPPQDQTAQAARPVGLAERQVGHQEQGHQEQDDRRGMPQDAPKEDGPENVPEDNQEAGWQKERRQESEPSWASALPEPNKTSSGKTLESGENVREAAHAGTGTAGSHEGAGEHELPLAIPNPIAPSRPSTATTAEEAELDRQSPDPEGAASQPKQSEASGCELSLCMIVRDEEDRIGACLKSIAPFVDEMIVVDTGSTDRTREAALRCGARVFDFPWTDSFAEARNQSIAQAQGRWIFWMDADDVIAPECGLRLRELVRQRPEADTAYLMQVQIPPGPGEFSGSVVDHVKLFPNRPDLRFEHRIHEQVLPALRRAAVPVEFSELYVTHQNYDRSPEGQAKKRRRDFRLLELDLADRPDHPFVLFNLGMTCLYATREYELAAHYLRRSLLGSHPQDSIVRKAYALLTAARIGQQDWGEALRANEEGRSHYPDDAELLFQAGQLYQKVGRFDLARIALERLTQVAEGAHYRSVDTSLRSYRGWHELALLFRQMGDGPHCERVLREIVEAHPEYLPAQADLAETLAELDRHHEAPAVPSGYATVAGQPAESGPLEC